MTIAGESRLAGTVVSAWPSESAGGVLVTDGRRGSQAHVDGFIKDLAASQVFGSVTFLALACVRWGK